MSVYAIPHSPRFAAAPVYVRTPDGHVYQIDPQAFQAQPTAAKSESKLLSFQTIKSALILGAKLAALYFVGKYTIKALGLNEVFKNHAALEPMRQSIAEFKNIFATHAKPVVDNALKNLNDLGNQAKNTVTSAFDNVVGKGKVTVH